MPETAERISYRFTRKELAALMKLMDMPNLPGISVTAAVPDEKTVQSLVESGAVMVCGERIFVDRAVSFVVSNSGASQKRLAVKGDKRAIVLLCGPNICVLADENGDVISLEPLQSIVTAREPLLEAAGRLKGKLHAEAVGRKGPLGEEDNLEGLMLLYDKIIVE